MSGPRRAYDILRGYVNREWDRLTGPERDQAQTELDAAMAAPRPRSASQPDQPDPMAPIRRAERARAVLGVQADASFAQIRKTFDRLNKRSDPNNFAPGSVEAVKAAEIQKQIHWAFGVLSEGVDPIAKRFGSLEID